MSQTTAIRSKASLRVRNRGHLFAVATLIAGGLSLAPQNADASGFLGARFGADHGTPVGANPFSVYFNPAALGAVKGTQLSIDAAVVYRVASYKRGEDALTPSTLKNTDKTSQTYLDYARSNTGTAEVKNILALPFAGIATDFGGSKLLHGGFAVYIPYGGLASWKRDDSFKNSQAPGGVDGPQRWFNISGRIISLYSTAALAITIPDTRLSFGVNGSLVHHTLETARARNSNGSDDTLANDQLIEGRALIEASGFNAAASLGVYYEAIPDKLSFGASYNTRPGFGQMRLKGTLKTQFGQNSRDDKNDIELLQTYPDVWRIGAAYRVSEAVELRLDGEYVTWSNFKRQCLVNADQDAQCKLYDNGGEAAENGDKVIQVIERNWKDAFAVRLGVGYFVSESTEVFGSALYDTTAVPDSTLDPTFIDANKIHWVLGARQKITPKFALAGSFNHVYFFERDTTGKNVFATRVGESRQPSASGVYNQQFFYLNINGTYTF